jgi:hypothetical protein
MREPETQGVLLVHGIVRSDEASRCVGVLGMRLAGAGAIEAVPHGRLTALVTALDACPELASTTVREFQRVAEEIHARATMVPCRFEPLDGGREAVDRFLACRAPRLETLLAEFEGCVELGVRVPEVVAITARNELSGAGGASYLLRRKSEYQDADGVPEWLSDAEARSLGPLRSLSRRVVVEGPRAHRPFAMVKYLVPRADVDGFERMVSFVRAASGLELVLMGPWPPYSFV